MNRGELFLTYPLMAPRGVGDRCVFVYSYIINTLNICICVCIVITGLCLCLCGYVHKGLWTDKSTGAGRMEDLVR
jgi:hypothetical protein